MEQPVCIKRVANYSLIKVEFESTVTCHFSHLPVHLARLCKRDPFTLCQVGVYRLAFRRLHIRIKLKAPPNNLDSVFFWKGMKRCFEIAFADITEGTDNIRPDLHLHEFLTLTFKQRLWSFC